MVSLSNHAYPCPVHACAGLCENRTMPVKQKNPEQQQLVDLRFRIRHSAAHIMAEAVLDLFPEAKFAVGPPTADGFYYDFSVSRPFSPEDMERIEARMRETIVTDAPFRRAELPRDEASEHFADQPFKLEIISEIPEGEAITDLRARRLRGPLPRPARRLDRRGGRVQARERRGRVLARRRAQRDAAAHLRHGMGVRGRAGGAPGAVGRGRTARPPQAGAGVGALLLRPRRAQRARSSCRAARRSTNALTTYVRSLYERYGYQEVITPQVFDSSLWKRSGHYDNYRENMYFIHADEQEFAVKPMNCPAAAILYGSQLHSYRDLPIRYADFGRLHRFERSGVTHGLTRVRTFSQDDAHIFCAPEQVESEIVSFIGMVSETFDVFGFEDVRVVLSLRPEKRIGTDDLWDTAEGALESALDARGTEYEPAPNEGAFYGPKIDFFVADAIGREWQLSTVQLDYNLPERFDLEFVDSEGARRRPVVIHRAMLGSIERFLGVVIEHFGGAFPVWLAPVQAEVIPIADRHVEYAVSVRSRGWRRARRPGTRGRSRRAHEREDSRRAVDEDAVHARGGRQGGGSRRRGGAPPLRRGPRPVARCGCRLPHRGRGGAPGVRLPGARACSSTLSVVDMRYVSFKRYHCAQQMGSKSRLT